MPFIARHVESLLALDALQRIRTSIDRDPRRRLPPTAPPAMFFLSVRRDDATRTKQGGEILDKAQRQEAELRQAQHELEHRRDQETSLVSF